MSAAKLFIGPEQVHKLNEKHGWFHYGDAQSDVSNAFANDAIASYERIRSAAPAMLAALQAIIAELEGPNKPFSADSYLPNHLIVAAMSSVDEAIGGVK